MPITQDGWELLVSRKGLQRFRGETRTYGTYQAYLMGAEIAGLSGYMCECSGPGDNAHQGSHKRIKPGRYGLHTQFGIYRTIGYSEDTHVPGKPHMPGLDIDIRDQRDGILIHPGHPPNLYISSVGCLNPTKQLAASEMMNFWDSRARVIALIESLRQFYPDAFRREVSTPIANAWIVVDSDPMNEIEDPSPMVASR